MLRYLIANEYDGIEVLPERIERQNYAIGLPEGSPLRESINRVLLSLISQPEWEDTLFHYMGQR